MSFKSNILNLARIKYLKLVSHVEEKRMKWAYENQQIDDEFKLHWQSNSGKVKARHWANVNKVKVGELIILCQNHREHGHKVTHIVEVIGDRPQQQGNKLVRLVKAIWIPKNGYEQAPMTKDVIGNQFSFRSGLLININCQTIKLNQSLLNLLI
ncbi:MAG: hypothetical protein AAGE84_16030 [Cyanobacteria bacterium P01_G01_bin.39]